MLPSPEIATKLNAISGCVKIPTKGIQIDLIWSDPCCSAEERILVKKAPRPYELKPSKFFLECMEAISTRPRGFAIDFGSGYGRHSFLLAELGYLTVALEFDLDAICSFGGTKVSPVRCDLDKGVPISAASASLVVATEYPQISALGDMAALVEVGGFLVFETFSARGGNWRSLPEPSVVRSMLNGEFAILRYIEQLTGAAKGNRCTVKVFAHRVREEKSAPNAVVTARKPTAIA